MHVVPAYQPADSGRTRSASPGSMTRKAVPRGDISHLYAPHTSTSACAAATGCQPTAWVASTTVSAPWARAAAAIAAVSATSPVADCTAL